MSAHYFKDFRVLYNGIPKRGKDGKYGVSRAREDSHPHIVVGENEKGEYISFNLTDSTKISGKKVVELNKNPQRSFVVLDEVYFLDKSSYSKPRHGHWEVDRSDYKKLKDAVSSGKLKIWK